MLTTERIWLFILFYFFIFYYSDIIEGRELGHCRFFFVDIY